MTRTGIDNPVDERQVEWMDPAGTVTLSTLRRRLAPMIADGRPLLICSTEVEDEVRASLDELADDVDVYASQNMPRDRRVYVVSARVRPLAGL